ncbi:MAG TPA: dihydroorotase [Bacteroidetes bacterium]|nr:dihydroorotase [Bacteroidota bacterium]
MNVLLKNAQILDINSKYHKKKTNIHIVDGIIKSIGNTNGDKNSQIIESKNLNVSPGWLDIGTRLTDPGKENLDTIFSLSASAIKGGFTGLAVFPNTVPVMDNKSVIESILHKTKNTIVDFHPIGSITVGAEGKEISEMIDMHKHGAVAFSDGKNPLKHSGVISRALRYTSNLNATVINHPEDMDISESGIINEGKMSVFLGMKGRPVLAETMMLYRDLKLAEYNNSSLIAHMISSSESVKMIKTAKSKKHDIYSTVSFHNLVEDESVLKDFNSFHKVLPPLRTKADVNALIRGINNDAIDAIVSNHYQLDIEDKRKAFYDAKYGAISLEYMFGILNSRLNSKLKLEKIIEKISTGPRKILGLENVTIEQGQRANMTIFDPDIEWTLTESDIKSKSSNTPYLGYKLKGKVLGIINKGKFN